MPKELKLLCIHCTATPEGREVTSQEIRMWHLMPPPVGRGWKQVGYSDMIHLDGSIENLVPYNKDQVVDPWEITNGATGFNSIARHVVYVGGLDQSLKPKDTLTTDQKDMLVGYIQAMIRQHPEIRVCGHRDLDPKKSCPSFDVARFCLANGVQEKNIYQLKSK